LTDSGVAFFDGIVQFIGIPFVLVRECEQVGAARAREAVAGTRSMP